MSEGERGKAGLGIFDGIAGGAVDGRGTGISDGGGGKEIKAGDVCAEKGECSGVANGGINSVRGVDWRTESRNSEVVGTKAKESSLEIGAIVPGRAGLQNGGTGISDVGIGDATINPGGGHS